MKRSLLLAFFLLFAAWPLPARDVATVDAGREEKSAKKGKKEAAAGKEPARSPAQAEEDQEEDEKGPGGVRFAMRGHPRLRFGKVLWVDLRAKFQNDFRGYSPELKTDEGLHDLHRARIGVQGRFLKHFEFEVEREVESLHVWAEGQGSKLPWRDVFVNFRRFGKFQIKAGKFKLPFSMDQLSGDSDLDFVYRSRIAEYLAPARDIGIMAHGRLFKRRLSYEAGLFKHDGENARIREVDEEGRRLESTVGTGQRAFAGRVTGTPLRLLPVPQALKTMEFGGAFTSTTVPEGLKGLRGRTLSGETFFEHFFVHGHRLRLGAEVRWTPGPFALKAEFIHVQEERRGQGLRGRNIPDLIGRGWYVSGAWMLTGERQSGGSIPRKAFPLGRGIGAVELVGRYEQLRFGSSEHPGRPALNLRAANILGNSDRMWTFGVNWYVNRFVKVQGNFAREIIEDPQRSPIFGRERFWMRVVRLQFVL